jgi:hypothetical protein
MKKKSFSTIFGLLFSVVGLIVGVWITNTAVNEDYNHFYIYSTISGFITAKLIAKYLIEKRNRYTNPMYVVAAVLSGLLSHWVCWYIITLGLNFRYWVLGEHFFSKPLDPLSGFFVVLTFCLFSWVFVGWATIIGGILSIYTTSWIYREQKIPE